MRFLAVTTSFPRYGEDHAGRFVHDLHVALRELGHEVLTVCPEAPEAAPQEEGEAGRVIRVPYTPPGAPDLFYGDGVEENARRSPRALGKMRRFIDAAARALRDEQDGTDAVLAHWIWPCGVAAVRAVSERSVPVIGIGHGADLHLLARPIVGRILARSLRGALHGALVTTDRGAEVVRKRLQLRNVIVAPMGTDPARFTRARNEPPPWGTDYVLGLGRLIPIKGFDLLVDAAARVGSRLVIAGDGPERDRLAARAREVGADLLLPGHLGPQDAAQAVTHARAVVISSRPLRSGRTEGTPVVAVEAIVAGTPLIAARTGGLPQLLPPDALFPPDDPHALTEMLRRLSTGWNPPAPDPSNLTRTATARHILTLLSNG